MIQTFPAIRPFLPASLRWRLADAVEEGPAPYGLPTVDLGIDGGGWWEASLGGMAAGNGWHHRALRAMAMNLMGGSLINVQFVEQAPFGLPDRPVGFDDLSTFSDGAGFIGGTVTAHLEEDVGLRDDEAIVRITTGQEMLGGEIFSLDRGPLRGHEMHGTKRVEHLGGELWSVQVGPQFRQAHAAGTECNFSEPMCCMRLKDREGGLWPTFERNWIGRASALFVEAMFPAAPD